MTDVRDIESAYLQGDVVFSEWREKWEASFYRPLLKRTMRQMIVSLPPEVKAQLKRKLGKEIIDDVLAELGQ